MIPAEMIGVSYRCPKCDVLRSICSVDNYHYAEDGMDKTVINLKCTKCKSEIGSIIISTFSESAAKSTVKRTRKKKSMSVGIGELTEPK